jgi:ABC-type antimicrobial peptide transport system permease subunit
MKFFRPLRLLFCKDQLDQELADELRFHLEKQIEQNIAAGMSAEEARYAALRKFGGVEQVKEECRDAWGVRFIDALLQDVRFGLRILVKNPGITAVAVITLAVGIGANTTIFSVAWRPMRYRDADRLLMLWETPPEGSRSPGGRVVVVLMVIFALVALLMGSVGLYGVISYSVTQRTAEFALRMALGAPRREIFRPVAYGALRLLMIGGALGILLALGAARLLGSTIFGISPYDPFTFLAVPLVLLAVVLVASYLPARRAMKVDPMVALRYE